MSVSDSLPLLCDGLLPKLLGARVPTWRQGFEPHQLIAIEDSKFAAAIHHPQLATPRTFPPENGFAAVRVHAALYHADETEIVRKNPYGDGLTGARSARLPDFGEPNLFRSSLPSAESASERRCIDAVRPRTYFGRKCLPLKR